MFSTCCSGKLCWVASLLRDVTGEPCWNHGVDAAGSAMLRLWHGLGLLQMLGFKARVQRTGFQVNLARVGGRSKRVQEHKKRESCTLARCFKQSDLDTAHRRLVESECLYGAEPRPCPWFLMISACVI